MRWIGSKKTSLLNIHSCRVILIADFWRYCRQFSRHSKQLKIPHVKLRLCRRERTDWVGGAAKSDPNGRRRPRGAINESDKSLFRWVFESGRLINLQNPRHFEHYWKLFPIFTSPPPIRIKRYHFIQGNPYWLINAVRLKQSTDRLLSRHSAQI